MAAAKGNRYNAAETRGRTALQRFAEKCRFDPVTGCVLWTGATSAGRGNSTRYGVFWDGEKVYAHRWSAVNIHEIDLGDDDAGHCCPHGHNSLCVQHLEGTTKADNIAERNTRVAKAKQSNSSRQFWLFVALGFERAPEAAEPRPDEVPFYTPPEWLRPFLKPVEANDDCPF